MSSDETTRWRGDSPIAQRAPGLIPGRDSQFSRALDALGGVVMSRVYFFILVYIPEKP